MPGDVIFGVQAPEGTAAYAFFQIPGRTAKPDWLPANLDIEHARGCHSEKFVAEYCLFMKVDSIKNHAVHDYMIDDSPIVYWCRTSREQGKYTLEQPPKLWCNEPELTATSGGARLL